jgi:predicted LPLAT superfamily acyltransferase
MTLRWRWRYEIHRRDVGRGSLVASGGVGSVAEVVDIAKENPQMKIRILAPLDETQNERDKLAALNIERLLP